MVQMMNPNLVLKEDETRASRQYEHVDEVPQKLLRLELGYNIQTHSVGTQTHTASYQNNVTQTGNGVLDVGDIRFDKLEYNYIIDIAHALGKHERNTLRHDAYTMQSKTRDLDALVNLNLSHIIAHGNQVVAAFLQGLCNLEMSHIQQEASTDSSLRHASQPNQERNGKDLSTV